MRTAALSLPRSCGGHWRRRLGLALLGLVAALSAGCGWRAGYELPGGARTVAVEYLDNRTLLRELEVPFAEELHRALLDRVPAQLGSGAETDLVIRGTLIDLRSCVEATAIRLSEAVITLKNKVEHIKAIRKFLGD